MVAKAVEAVTAAGVSREVEGDLSVASKGLTFFTQSEAKVGQVLLLCKFRKYSHCVISAARDSHEGAAFCWRIQGR